jgi:signal transduction histidine kinase/CheY-like chemotaxis protein
MLTHDTYAHCAGSNSARPSLVNTVMVDMTAKQAPFILMTYLFCVYKTKQPFYLLLVTFTAWSVCLILQKLITTTFRNYEKYIQYILEVMKGCFIVGMIVHFQIIAGPDSPAYLFMPFSMFVGTYAISILITNKIFLMTTIIVKILLPIITMYYIGNSVDEILIATMTLILFGGLSLMCCDFTSLIIDMEKKQGEATRLQHTLELYKKLYKHAPVMFLSLDANTFNIIDANEQVKTVSNMSDMELKCLSFLDLFHEDYKVKVENCLHSLQENGSEIAIRESDPYQLKDKDVYVSMCAYVMRDTPTQQVILHVILFDVTAVVQSKRSLKVLNMKLMTAKEKAEQSNLAKSQFLAMMSHELRTPLHAAICSCDLLQDTVLSEDQRNFVDVMSTSSNMLLKLITKILDFSKIEAGALTLDSKPFNLWDSIKSVIESLRFKAQEKLVSLSLVIYPTVPRDVIGDSTRIAQVLINLISNAIKFTEPNGSVEVALDISSKDSSMLQFSVKDNGIGVPAESLGLLFKPFSQVDNSTTRRFDGTGLGLCISKSIAEVMGGTIHVESVEGKGSTFTFFCKLQFNLPNEIKSEIVSPTKSFSPEQYSILVAEDNPINRNVMQKMLSRIGFKNIVMAVDGEKAFLEYKSQHFDVILMDNCMPRVDGLMSTRMIRAYEKETSKTPVLIIAVTASATKSQRLECFAAGMDEFLTKPVVMGTLRDTLEQLLVLKYQA